MSNNKQSSVEWLSNQSYELFEQYSEGNFDRITLNKLMLKATEQAKAMHEKEVVDAYREGRSDQQSARNQSFYHRNAEQYYNEIYGKDE